MTTPERKNARRARPDEPVCAPVTGTWPGVMRHVRAMQRARDEGREPDELEALAHCEDCKGANREHAAEQYEKRQAARIAKRAQS